MTMTNVGVKPDSDTARDATFALAKATMSGKWSSRKSLDSFGP
jgi:hypothetical protein